MIDDPKAKGSGSPTLVTASALGRYVFCAEAARLDFLGARPGRQARQSMARGEAAHGHWQQREDRAPARESRIGRLALIMAALLALLAFLWATVVP